jgi:2-C-methyl-D-erythritol 4-phosphate cytidylyltransferase/2-C-methyl-D-erythritol 2,4-cyclodiphosphate synthase
MNTWAIVLAAGSSSRLCRCGYKDKKQFLTVDNLPLYWQSVDKFSRCPSVSGITIAFPRDEFEDKKKEAEELGRRHSPGVPVKLVPGGDRRQDSVFNALNSLPRDCDLVFVHDAARPFFTPALLQKLLNGLENASCASVIPVLPCRDTVKAVCGPSVEKTLPRENIVLVQTPQLFIKDELIKAHNRAQKDGFTGTDDASLVEKHGENVHTVPGEEKNIKITTPEDLECLKNTGEKQVREITGFGYDVHSFGGSRQMILGGIPIPNGPKIKAHSDGDVLLHALTDAILGLMGMGDIGDQFPDSDPDNLGKSSSVFLAEALHLAEQNKITLTHMDLTIITQIPRLSEYKPLIKKNIMGITGLSKSRINVKATTEEGLGFTGEKKGIKAVAVVSGQKHNQG